MMGVQRDRDDSESDSDADGDSGSGRNSSSSDASSCEESASSSESRDLNSSSASGSDDKSHDGENFEVGFWQSVRAVLPWTDEGNKADYAEERLDAREEFQEELDQALLIRKMVEMGLHDRALERLMAVTEGQMYHDFHKHRYVLEQSGAWSFVPPSVKRKWRVAVDRTDKVEKLRAYMAMRRDRFLRIRALCAQVRGSGINRRDLVVTIIPKDLIDKDLLAMAGKADNRKANPAGRSKKCHWHRIGVNGEACTCTNYRMVHPHRLFRDEFGVMVHDTLTTCGWHATHCVSKVHGDHPVLVSTANEGALCNECLAQIVKGPLRQTTAFGAPGVRVQSNHGIGATDADTGDEPLAWNKWFTKGPGRFRKSALRPRHPQVPPGNPPVGLRPAAVYIPPPPPPPMFSMANIRRHQKLAKWRLRKEAVGGSAATRIQCIYRGYSARHERDIVALEHPARALKRVESAVVMQSLVRRFLARSLVLQIVAFRDDSATAIQRIVRGVQARALYRRKRAEALVTRQMLFYIARSFMASARVAKKVREEMRKKHGVVLSLQRVWRGRKGREIAARLRHWRVRRVGGAITVQNAFRSWLARRELRRRQRAYVELVRAVIKIQSAFRMAIARMHVKETRAELLTAALQVQPIIRGFLAKRCAQRERNIVDQGVSATSSQTPASAKSSGLKRLPGEEHFTAGFDKDRTGTCTKVEFKMALESFCRAVGYPLQKDEALSIFKRYYDGDGFCGWHSFLTTYHAGEGGNTSCARHGKLLCALCVRHGGCEKPGCMCVKATAGRSKQLGFKMCECGHPFDAHRVLAGAATPDGRALRMDSVIDEKRLSSLLAGTRTVFSTDHPINVGGCSVASTSATIGRRVDFVKASPAWKRRGHEKSYRRRGPHSSRRDRGSSRVRSHVSHVGDKLPEPLPSFSGGKEKGCPSTSPPRRRQITRNVGPEDTQLSPTPEASTSASPSKKRCLPTLQDAKRKGELSRDMPWEGRRGQVERAEEAKMGEATQGRNAAEYALKLQADLAANKAFFDGRSLSLATVQSKKELQHGFLISDPVPFVKGDTLKATVDPIGLYLSILKSLSDERHGLLEDTRRFTDFVSRHAAFFERHWCKLMKDIRNSRLDPHLPISDEKRKKLETLMIPGKKRGQKLDDGLRVLGFHARASGSIRTGNNSTKGDKEVGICRLTQAEGEESLVERANASRKRPVTVVGKTDSVGGVRGRRRTLEGGEMESEGRLMLSRVRARARSRSDGAVQVLDRAVLSQLLYQNKSAFFPADRGMTAMQWRASHTAEEPAQTAYELLTVPSTAPAGIVRAPSGRRMRKHVCMHPGCGKVFHLKASAVAHQEKEHQFKRRLATATPFTDQFLSTVWPADGLPWMLHASSKRIKSSSVDSAKVHSLNHDEAVIHPQFVCGVPGCRRRFSTSRLLGLHLRMGHSAFDLEKMEQAARWALDDGEEGGERGARGPDAATTPDGLTITSSVAVGWGVRAKFIGPYSLVPPFNPPTGCPAIPHCAKHCWLQKGCLRCQDVEAGAAPVTIEHAVFTTLPEKEYAGELDAGKPSEDSGGIAEPVLGLPLPPVKFYSRAWVKVIHHGRPITLDLDSAEPVRCAILARLPAFRYQCPAPTSTKNTYTSAERGNSSVSKQNADGKQLHEGVGSAVAIEIGCHDGVSHCASSNKFQVVEKASVLGAGCIEEEERESEVVAAWDGDSDGLLIHKPQEGDRGECNRSECGNGDPIESGGEAVAHSGCTRGVNGEGCLENSAGTGSGPSSRGNASKSPHHEVLARIVAVLVDGRGKGWLAVRRLWSVREVGLAALLLAGLGAQDLDRQQEFLLAKRVEYLPMSLVTNTCAVMVGQRDDIHAKQRLGDLPKSVRYMSHGFDSATGLILRESELKSRGDQLLTTDTAVRSLAV